MNNNRNGKRGGGRSKKKNAGGSGSIQNPRNKFKRRRSNRRFVLGNYKLKDGNFSNKTWTRFQETRIRRLTEEEISLTEYLNDVKGFHGVIASRISDIQVAEIKSSGEVAKLTDPSASWPPQDEQEDDCPPDMRNESPNDNNFETFEEHEDVLYDEAYMTDALPVYVWDQLKDLVEYNGHGFQIDITEWKKKEHRRAYDAISKTFRGRIRASAKYLPSGQRYMNFVVSTKIKKKKKKKDVWSWPGDHVHFVMYKENCDTLEAATRIMQEINKHSGKPEKLFEFGSTSSERRAKTSQWLSAYRINPHRFAIANKRLGPIRLGNFTFKMVPVAPNQMLGNRFRMCLRNVTASDKCVEGACSLLRERGFINYYGLQRFGHHLTTPNYVIGMKILQENYEQAVNDFLEVRDGPIGDVLREYFRAGAKKAAKLMSPAVAAAHKVEAHVLVTLKGKEPNYVEALNHVNPYNFLKEFQYLVWNQVTTERIRRSRHLLVGDLIAVARNEAGADGDTAEPGFRKRDVGDSEDMVVSVRALTQEDIDGGKYTIHDVVLPLPGQKVEYPSNMKDYYAETLAKFGLQLDLPQSHRKYMLAGAYRSVVVRPTNMEWKMVRYSDPLCDLLLSDVDEMEGRTTTGEDANGNYRALLLTMDLRLNCCGTVALRELLRTNAPGGGPVAGPSGGPSSGAQAARQCQFSSNIKDQYMGNKRQFEGATGSNQKRMRTGE